MTQAGKTWRYRFIRPDESEVESGDFDGDEAAEAKARDLSTAGLEPIIVHRHSGFVDAWEYVIEVDERPDER